MTQALRACAVAMAAAFFGLSGVAYAEDAKVRVRFDDLLNMPEAKEKLDGSVKFFFGNQPTPQVQAKLGNDQANKPTFRGGKTDEFACRWAALAALVALQDKARYLGANAVIHVASYDKSGPLWSTTEFECRVNAFTVHAGLRATYAKVAD